jgi:hypothetical protein
MLLLRGGSSGTPKDFTTDAVADSDILKSLPYYEWLVGGDGPFGQSTYAFIFRMKPDGVARPHRDNDLAWKEPFRLHIPITTNDDAFLLAEGRAKHFSIGEVWTFDNQSMHAVVNGDSVRTHLIIDVPRNPKLDALLEKAHFDPGVEDPERWQRTLAPKKPEPLLYALSAPFRLRKRLSLVSAWRALPVGLSDGR